LTLHLLAEAADQPRVAHQQAAHPTRGPVAARDLAHDVDDGPDPELDTAPALRLVDLQQPCGAQVRDGRVGDVPQRVRLVPTGRDLAGDLARPRDGLVAGELGGRRRGHCASSPKVLSTSLYNAVSTGTGGGAQGMADGAVDADTGYLPTFDSVEDERVHRKQRLAAAYRLFGRFGLDEGAAGHITVRDPEHADHFWVNRLGQNFSQVRASDLLCVDERGDVVEGDGEVNEAAFAIHSQIHRARPDVMAAAHSHSTWGKAWSATGALLDPLTQDACMFFED